MPTNYLHRPVGKVPKFMVEIVECRQKLAVVSRKPLT